MSVSRSPRRVDFSRRTSSVVSAPERCDSRTMRTKPPRPSLPYIMDLETGISQPQDCALEDKHTEPASHDAIRRRAYSLSKDEGRPGHRGPTDWLHAETKLRPNFPSQVQAIPSARLDAFTARGPQYVPATGTATGPPSRKARQHGPSPLCRAAIGDDIRDYAFHLYVQSGCAPDQEAESWREARRCLEARVPETTFTHDQHER
jgi:hypothetical protein